MWIYNILPMDPKIWGKPMWSSLLNIAKVYPERPSSSDMNNYKIFFTILGSVLPCYACRKNYKNHLRKIPIQLQSRESLIKWLHKIYNQTQLESKKKEVTLKKFFNKYSTTSSGFFSWLPSSRNIIILMVILTIIFVAYYYFVYKRYSVPFFLR